MFLNEVNIIPSSVSNVLSVKEPGHEADHSISTSAEVKKTWIYIPTLPYVFMA
jgi:hypothetical protein